MSWQNHSSPSNNDTAIWTGIGSKKNDVSGIHIRTD